MNNYWCAWAISSWTGIFRQPSLFPASVCNWNRLRVEFQSEFYALRPSLSTAADFSSQVLTLGLTRSMFTFPWALLFLCAAVAHVRLHWTTFLPADHFPLTLVVSYSLRLMFELTFFITNLLSNLASFAL